MNLQNYLDEKGVHYRLSNHPPTYTSQDLAAAEHIPGRQVIKPVVVRADGEWVICALPASYRVDLRELREQLRADDVALADEQTLERLFLQYLPEGEPLYPPDYLTDQSERFFVSEIVREQVLDLTHDELPFSTAVIVDRFDESEATLLKLYCTILVERESQKGIVVGKGGDMIKQIGTAARIALEAHFESRVFLDLHVKVKSEWRNDERALDEINLQNRSSQ